MKNLKILLCFILALSIFIFVRVAIAQENDGMLKIDPIPANQPWDPKDPSWQRNPTGANPDSIFYIQVDELEPIKISAKDSGLVEHLNVNKKHIIKIVFNGKRIESFWFNFKEYECNKLRLWYKPMYATWSLWPNGEGCRLQ